MTPLTEPVVHGITNCDTVKKARAWLDAQGVAYRFHDFRKQGVPLDALARWVRVAGWEPLINRAGTTWRKLPEADRAQVVDTHAAMQLMQLQPSVIKRPLVEWPGGDVTVGFSPADWAARIAPR